MRPQDAPCPGRARSASITVVVLYMTTPEMSCCAYMHHGIEKKRVDQNKLVVIRDDEGEPDEDTVNFIPRPECT